MVLTSTIVLAASGAGLAPFVFAWGASERSFRVKRSRLEKRRSTLASTEAAVMATGPTGMSLFDLYQASGSELLDRLQDRYPDAIPEDAGPFFWLSYFAEKEQNGAASVQGLRNGWIGQLGEDSAVDHLERQGLIATPHEARNHPGTDLTVTDSEGLSYQAQVKNVKDVNSFTSSVKGYEGTENEPRNYIVNSELYSKLEESNQLEELSQRGISVDDGGFSHAELTAQCEEAMEDFSEAMDVAENVPILAFFVFAQRTVSTAGNVYSGKATLEEAGYDVAGHALRIGTRGTAAWAGAKVGAAVGTWAIPGIGTFVGGAVGAIAATLAAGQFIDESKDYLKYREIYLVLNSIGERFRRHVAAQDVAYEKMVYNIYGEMGGEEIEVRLREQEELQARFGLPTVSGSDPISVSNVLVNLHRQRLSIAKRATKHASRALPGSIVSLTRSAPEGERDAILGALIASSGSSICARHEEDELLRKYDELIEKYPNHPYRLNGSGESVPGGEDAVTALKLEILEQAIADEESALEEQRRMQDVTEVVSPPVVARSLLGVAMLTAILLVYGFSLRSDLSKLQAAPSEVQSVHEQIEAPQRAVQTVGVVRVATANCRSLPSRRGQILRQLERATEVVEVGRKDAWVRIDGDRECWIHEKLLDMAPSPSP